jgi:2-polyprenyl-3-methyl-5-hydroxy-6-metoxy-1,4-benzoquinol methylase
MITLETWKDRFRNALKKEHAKYFDYKTNKLNEQFAQYVVCPVCNSDKFVPYFKKDLFEYVRCSQCSMVFMNPRLNNTATYGFYNSEANEIYNEAKFYQEGATDKDDAINYLNLKLIIEYRAGERGNLLEIGSARGFFLQVAKEYGYNVYGVELNRINWQYSRDQVAETIYNVDLLNANFPDDMFDVIYMRDVIEHLPNPQAILQECFRIAKPGSTLFIETHNIDSLINKLVREKHTVIFGFEHINHWSPKTLENLLNSTGFKIKKVKFSSRDFTLSSILQYLFFPSFTTIFPPKENRYLRILVRLVLFILRLPGIRHLDNCFGPHIANWLKLGSVMKVFAEKSRN